MDHLVHVEEKEITVNFALGRKCKTVLRFRSLMHTMSVAFKLQTTSPYKFSVRPSSGYIPPLAECTIDIILRPQHELPLTFPFSDEKFVLKTALAPSSNDNSALPLKVCKEWFSSVTTHVYVDAKLKVVYIGAHILRQCVANEDVFAVEQILLRQTAVSVAAEDGRTALHVAASIGSSKLVDMLLKCGADVDATDAVGKTPLLEAMSGGHVDIVKELLACGALTDMSDPFHTAAIHVAAKLASPKVLKILIECGAALETKDQEGRTALHFAVEEERIESLKALLRAGADVNAQRADGRTPLLIAADNGSLEMVHLLLEGGAKTNIKAENGQAASEVASEKGHVVIVEALKAGEELLRATRRGDVRAVTALLQHGSGGERAWAQDSAGWTALHVAAFKGHVQIVRRLLLAEGGMKALQEPDAEGHTPLHCAAEGGSREVVELLLAMGADPLVASSRGATPAELASALGFTPIARLLQQRACRPALDYPSQKRLEFHAKGMERECSSITKSPPPVRSRQSLLPSSDLSSLQLRAVTPSLPSREATAASSIRFSTPNKLPQIASQRQLTHKPYSTPSSLRSHADDKPRHPKSDSLMDQKNIALSQPQGSSATHMLKSSDVQPMLHSDVQKVMGHAAQSMHPFRQPASSSVSLELPAALEQNTGQPQQKSPLLQSHHIWQEPAKEYNAAAGNLQHKTSHNVQDSRQHNPKRALTTLLYRVHGSELEADSSSSRKSTESKMRSEGADDTSNQRDLSTTKKAAILPSDTLSQNAKFLQYQQQDGHNLVSCEKHQTRQDDVSMFQRDKSMMKEVVVPTLDRPLQDRAFIQKDSKNLTDGNQHCPRPGATPLSQRHKSPAKEVALPTSDMLLQDRAIIRNQVKDGKNQHLRRQDVASLYQRNKSTTAEATTPTSSQCMASVQNQVNNDRNFDSYNHNSEKKNSAPLSQRSKSATKEVAVAKSEKERAPIQQMTHERPSHGHQHHAAASSLSKRTQKTCKEAQLGPLKSSTQQQLTNGEQLKGRRKNKVELYASLATDEDQVQKNGGHLPAIQAQLLGVERSTDMKCEQQPLLKMQQRGNAIVGIEDPSLASEAQPELTDEGIKVPALNKQKSLSSASLCRTVDDNTTVEEEEEDANCLTSSRSLISHSDLARIITTPNPADSELLHRPHMEQACSSLSTSSSAPTSPKQLLQSKHNHMRSHVGSLDVSRRNPQREMMTDTGTDIMPSHQSTSPPCKADRMLQVEETQSLKPACKASWNDQNRPIYTPPLRIKQMRRPMSTPILRNSNSPRQMRAEEVPTKATGTSSEERPAKARSVTFRDLLREGTF